MPKETPVHSPRQQKKMEASRMKSDINLMRQGAEVTEEGRLDIPTWEISQIAYEGHKEWENKLAEAHMGWIKRHVLLIGGSLASFGGLSTMSLMVAAKAGLLDGVPLEAGQATLGVTRTVMIVGVSMAILGEGFSGNWKTKALVKAREAAEEEALKAKLMATKKSK